MTKEKIDALMARYRCDTIEALVDALAHDNEAMRENMKEMQRDHRDAIAEATHRERTGEPYGTY